MVRRIQLGSHDHITSLSQLGSHNNLNEFEPTLWCGTFNSVHMIQFVTHDNRQGTRCIYSRTYPFVYNLLHASIIYHHMILPYSYKPQFQISNKSGYPRDNNPSVTIINA